MALMNLVHDAGYALVFVTMISVLVAAHELGHYLFARWFGMGVEEFAIGFGKNPILVWMRRTYLLPLGGNGVAPDPTYGKPGASRFLARAATVSSPNVLTAVAAAATASALEGQPSASHPSVEVETPFGPALRETTEFTIRPLPLGGFVRIKGMMPEDDGSETRIPGGFYSKAPWKRFLVLLAGPLFSILAGVFVLIPAQMINGENKPVNKPIIADVQPKGAADRAGLQKGDLVLSVGGKPVSTFYEIIQDLQASGGSALTFVVRRGTKHVSLLLTPTLDKEPTPVREPDLSFNNDVKKCQYKMEAMCESETVPLSFGAAASSAVHIPIEAADRLFAVVRKPSEFSDNVAGPATIVQATAQATQIGLWAVIELAGLLSISVGILNLLPAPPLDGGQMAMAVAEMLRGGRRLSIRAQAIAGTIGLTFVAALIFAALAVDFKRVTQGNSSPPEKAPSASPSK